jgi:hypothetical protein
MAGDKSVDAKGAKVNRKVAKKCKESVNQTFLATGNQLLNSWTI